VIISMVGASYGVSFFGGLRTGKYLLMKVLYFLFFALTSRIPAQSTQTKTLWSLAKQQACVFLIWMNVWFYGEEYLEPSILIQAIVVFLWK